MKATTERRSWIFWGSIFFLALAIRSGAAVWWQGKLDGPERLAFGDSDGYLHLAEAIAHGEPYEYGGPTGAMWRMPGYPSVLSLAFVFQRTPRPVLLTRLIGCLLGSFAVIGVGLLAWRSFDLSSGILAAALTTIYPGAIAMSVFVLSEALFAPLLVVQAYCWLRAMEPSPSLHRGWAIAAGVSSGLAVYARPSWILYPIFLAIVLACMQPSRAGDRLKQAAIAVLVMCVCMTPWWWRGYRLTGHFVLTTLELGATLYDGWNPNADGGSNMDFRGRFYDAQEAATPNVSPGEFAYRLNGRMRDAAIHWARENPSRVVELAANKVGRVWRPWPSAGPMRSGLSRTVIALGYLPLLLLGVFAAWRTCGERMTELIVLTAPAAYITLLHLFFVGSIRYRQPAMLLIIVLAASALSRAGMLRAVEETAT